MMTENREVGIGILGLGNIGKGALDILEKNKKFIEKEISPSKIRITGLADLDKSRKPVLEEYSSVFTSSTGEVINNPATDIVVEAIGGEYPAYNLIKQALMAGKHVVSPNKELIAKHGYELLEIAKEKKVQFLFETSVASAIPILGTLSNVLTSCPLDRISGILNGTTNYVLDLMFEKNMTQKKALQKAQEMGYAEADPSKDIMGTDTLYKIFILSSLGFRTRLDLNDITYSGITEITYEDIALAKELGYKIKLLATSNKKDDYINIEVQPMFVEQDDLLSKIYGANNGIILHGESYGELFFSGAGAGGIAGGSMIVSDIVRIIRQPEYFEYNYLLENSNGLKIKKFKQEKSRYFIRIREDIQKDICSKIVEILEQNDLSAEKHVKLPDKKEQDIGIITGFTNEDELRNTIRNIGERENNFKVMSIIKIFSNPK
ncbi:MAG: homoserine dehydrogenase [Atribacterota bacterium]|nr:homoserine dehydrogenase [Atribacterota bacterium]MDD3640917.1 homoserine dehydrogenase [Atribacterota bacterium]MDD4764655.1 homoserine dehydrogenase [Atribacterota bacterium]